MLRSSAKGTSPEAGVTSTHIDENHQALDVNVMGGDGGAPVSDLNRLPVDTGSTTELLKSINDRLGALLILLSSTNNTGEPTSFIQAAQTDLRA